MKFHLRSTYRSNIERSDLTQPSGGNRCFYMIPFAPFLLLLCDTADAAPPSSGVNDATPSEHVRIDGLDLQTPAGWRTAKARVSGAAARVCAAQPTPVAAARCRAESMARAKHELALRAKAQHPEIAIASTVLASARDDASRPLPQAEDAA